MVLKIEVFSAPGCGKCAHAKELLKEIASEYGEDKLSWREVNILDDMDYAVALGVMSTPAIAINEVLCFTSLPSQTKLRDEIEKRISDV